ncbi:unnamed protein product [Prorocentrum cordatum]|uniref:Uncharacterized protein n=1 Tax=Prorocentrum cordatum TaxID=2364126 RepID=A0ABN9VTT7_9DINO|nr:unnamed protein product [Polarella glacialis]
MPDFGRSRLAKHDPEFANRRAVPLPSGRPIRAATRRSREKLLTEFDLWLVEIAGYPCLGSLLEQTMGDPRIINGVLVEFGQYPSEFLLAKRAQLVLPRDILFERPYALFTIQLPKTATLGAKVQSARVEPPDIVEMLDCIIGAAPPDAMLWPMSGQTFRKRFNSLCRELRPPLNLGGKCRGALDLASLRAGGATQLFLETDDPHLV